MATHDCPGPECAAQVPQHMLACRRHWFQVPRKIRMRVWDAYHDQPNGTEHTQAMREAIAAMTP